MYRQMIKVLTLYTCLLLSIVACRADEFPECALIASGTFIATQNDCSSYIYCDSASSFVDSCPVETYFDAKAQECAFDDKGKCRRELAANEIDTTVVQSIQTQPPTTQIGNVLSTEIVTAQPPPVTDTIASVTHIGRPECHQGQNGFFAHPQRCEYYYRCLSGFLTIVRCNFNFAWDYLLQQCVPKTTARCFLQA